MSAGRCISSSGIGGGGGGGADKVGIAEVVDMVEAVSELMSFGCAVAGLDGE